MDTIIILFIALANIIAILLVYFSLGKGMDKQKKLLPTMIALGSVYIITLVTYLLSSIGIEKTTAAKTARDMIIMAFVPVNTILFVPFLIRSYLKMKNKDIEIETLNKRVIVLGIIAVIVLIGEFAYFRDYQKKLKQVENAVNNNQTSQNEQVLNETLYNNEVNNQVTNEEINVINNTANNTANEVSNVVDNVTQ